MLYPLHTVFIKRLAEFLVYLQDIGEWPPLMLYPLPPEFMRRKGDLFVTPRVLFDALWFHIVL